MEKVLIKVGSIKTGGYWLSKKAKKEFTNISDELSTLSNTLEDKAKLIFNKLKGKPQKTLTDLLREHNLPPGLFPQDINNFEFDPLNSKLTVHLPYVCEITFKDSSMVRYSTRVKGTLLSGKLADIQGMKTKVLVWVKVTNIAIEGYKSDKVAFTAGVKKWRPREAYDTPQIAINVKEF